MNHPTQCPACLAPVEGTTEFGKTMYSCGAFIDHDGAHYQTAECRDRKDSSVHLCPRCAILEYKLLVAEQLLMETKHKLESYGHI